MSKDKKPGESNGYMIAFAYLFHIAITIITCIAVALFAGYHLDRILGTTPWLLLLFIVLGILAAFKSIVDFAKKSKF